MVVNLIITFGSFLISVIMNKVFETLEIKKLNYKGRYVPYSGGTIIFLGISAALSLLFFLCDISFFKLIFFTMTLFCIYMIGFIDDVFGDKQVKDGRGILHGILSKKVTTGIIKSTAIMIVACYIYYFLNEEYWLLKGILTAATTNFFNFLDFKPGRCIKFYYVFYFVLSVFCLRWTRELYITSFFVISGYYYFNAHGHSMLGDNGSSLIGFILGFIITEALSTTLGTLIFTIIILWGLQLLSGKYQFSSTIQKDQLQDI